MPMVDSLSVVDPLLMVNPLLKVDPLSHSYSTLFNDLCRRSVEPSTLVLRAISTWPAWTNYIRRIVGFPQVIILAGSAIRGLLTRHGQARICKRCCQVQALIAFFKFDTFFINFSN